MSPTIRTLSIHADYACRHAGACCTSGWRVPVEPECEAVLRSSAGHALAELLEPVEGLPHGAVGLTRVRSDGACAFYQRGTGDGHGRCAIQREHGHAALPEACRHFPRVCLIHPRGVSITFSHYCPTAAAQLFRTDVPLAITDAPRSCPPTEDWQGLDARSALPPLLRPDMLMDLESYAAWEAHAVAVLAEPGQTPGAALARLAQEVELLRPWSPLDGSLLERVRRLRTARSREPFREMRLRPSPEPEHWHELVCGTVPDGLSFPAAPAREALTARWLEAARDDHRAALCAYLAARLFGTWLAFQGRGLRTVIAGLEASWSVLQLEAARLCARDGRALDGPLLREAIRQADLLLVHLADPAALAASLSEIAEH